MGARALEAALRVVRGLDHELALVRGRHVRRLMAINDQLIRELEADLRHYAGRNWTRARTEALLARARVSSALLAARMQRRTRPTLDEIGTEAAALSRTALARQLVAWERRYPGVLDIDPTIPAGALLDAGLIERYNGLSKAWSKRAIGTIRQTMEEGARAREALPTTWKRLSDNLRVPEWKAERIVRTETSYAANYRALEDFKQAADPSEWEKQLYATFDRRTGKDSKFVHLQTAPIDGMFEDNIGNIYPHPPNRPNDREVMVFIPTVKLPPARRR